MVCKRGDRGGRGGKEPALIHIGQIRVLLIIKNSQFVK